jgi:hypothetical protein
MLISNQIPTWTKLVVNLQLCNDFELPKNNNSGYSKVAKVVDQLTIFCYNNYMLNKTACL